MEKSASGIPNKLFYKIGEVCEITDTQPYVLRFWESEFPQLAPRKNRSGQRVYQRKDIDTVFRIKKLLYEEEYTIAGARRKLEEDSTTGRSAGNGGAAAHAVSVDRLDSADAPASRSGRDAAPQPESDQASPARAAGSRREQEPASRVVAARTSEADHPVDVLSERSVRSEPRRSVAEESVEPAGATDAARLKRLELALVDLKKTLSDLLESLRETQER